jgi:organic radical activating enzyme
MFGNNPKRKPLKGDGLFLNVKETFLTIQGEGILVGMPAVFVRLGGCNLACNFCDTEFEEFHNVSVQHLLDNINTLANTIDTNKKKLVVITGGEPFLQPIEKFCNDLVNAGYLVQIETNGTIYRPVHKEVIVMCSPKNNGHGYMQLREDLLQRISALKFIISASNTLYNQVNEVGQSKYNIDVYIQPMDEYNEVKNKANLELAIELAIKHGYRLSLQIHKYIGVR